ncbi:MAG: hypothetical protein IJR67_01850 [Acholeplasmatales bacterium]|nr:hypothetical protein [Acholeplasmatales bacterium]
MISNQSNACIHCGYPLSKAQHITNENMIKVHVHRKSKFVACAITNIVSVDGVQIGSVNNGETCEFNISPGLHSITIGKGLTGSVWITVADSTRQIDVKEDGDLYIEFENKTKMLRII